MAFIRPWEVLRAAIQKPAERSIWSRKGRVTAAARWKDKPAKGK